MKIPNEIRTYCPYCDSHQEHRVKRASKGQPRSLAEGNRSYERKQKGHGGKRAGQVSVRKRSKRQKVTLTCEECNKKQERVMGSRTTKKIEVEK